mgnify:CR=1 FL=1
MKLLTLRNAVRATISNINFLMEIGTIPNVSFVITLSINILYLYKNILYTLPFLLEVC